MDVLVIVFVRGKRPDAALVALARERHLVLLATQRRMFDACGVLYGAGLRGDTCRA
jgi:hypothetical protein